MNCMLKQQVCLSQNGFSGRFLYERGQLKIGILERIGRSAWQTICALF